VHVKGAAVEARLPRHSTASRHKGHFSDEAPLERLVGLTQHEADSARG